MGLPLDQVVKVPDRLRPGIFRHVGIERFAAGLDDRLNQLLPAVLGLVTRCLLHGPYFGGRQPEVFRSDFRTLDRRRCGLG